MSKTTLGGIVLLGVAVLALLSNMSDAVNDLKNWHDASTPQFVAALMKQIGSVGLAAVGGSLLPQPRMSDSKDRKGD